ncbi:MAG TPA: hypothetical protein PKE29_04870 [Phycisphaerales bacterium]|nr:hypothetical protein [Phycisphaerales bacterium]
MPSRTLIAMLAASVGSTAGATALADPPQPQAPQAKSEAVAPPADDANRPRIVVHKEAAPKDAADSRVTVGDMRISMSNWSPARPAIQPDAARPHAGYSPPPAATVRADGAVVIPDNTLGPGEPLWSISDRESAARKLAQAEADLASNTAARSARDTSGYAYPGFTGYGWLGGLNTWGGYTHGRFGLRGPVTTTITRSDSLGSTAQRAFAEAAYPRLDGSQDAHDRAVSRFGRDATPPIVRTQNDVDRARSNANKEHLGVTRPETR